MELLLNGIQSCWVEIACMLSCEIWICLGFWRCCVGYQIKRKWNGSQAAPDGHFSSVFGMQLSNWSKAENWNVGYWASSWGFGQNLRTDWPLHLFPSASQPWVIPVTCLWGHVASSDMSLTWAVSVSLDLTVAVCKIIYLKPYVETAVSDSDCLPYLSISANCLEWIPQ